MINLKFALKSRLDVVILNYYCVFWTSKQGYIHILGSALKSCTKLTDPFFSASELAYHGQNRPYTVRYNTTQQMLLRVFLKFVSPVAVFFKYWS